MVVKSISLILFLILVNQFCFGQDKLDANDQEEISTQSIIEAATAPEILRFYYNSSIKKSQIDSVMSQNSKRLKHTLPRVHFQHELARVLFYEDLGKKDQLIPIIYALKTSPLLSNDFALEASFQTLTGIICYNMQRSVEARDHYKKGLNAYNKLSDSTGIKGSIINIGNTYFMEENFDSAIFYFQNALLLSDAGIKQFDHNIKNNLATVYQNIGRYEEARLIYTDLINDTIKQEDGYSNSTTLINLGLVYQKQNRHEEAINIINASLINWPKNRSSSSKFNAYSSLGQSYYHNSEFKLAYQAMSTSDSLREIEDKIGANRMMDEFNLKYESALFEKKEVLSLENAKNEQKLKELYQAFLILTALLLALIIFLYAKKNQKNALLAKKNFELTESKKKVNDNVKQASPELIMKLEELFINKKTFCRPDINLDKLAKLLKTNRTYLSESINTHFGISFSVLINKLRIQEARELLISKKFDHYSIEGVAQTVGYKSISSFNTTFKKETGITPSYFRKMNQVA
ncbi:MAG: AraC-like DNA-binding protein [Crocinitomix sp.]|jgi:AraC-like DNA-binding protein